jgi:hypothetical protein
VLGSALKTEAYRNQGVELSELVDPLFEPYSDKALSRRMAALRPSSSFWRADAASRNIRVPSAKTIHAEDAKLTREYESQYQQPQPKPTTEELREAEKANPIPEEPEEPTPFEEAEGGGE